MSERQAEIDRIAKILCGNKHIGCKNGADSVIKPCEWCYKSAVILVDNNIRTAEGFEVDCTKRDGFDNWVGIQPKQYKDDERTIEREG